MNETTYNNKQMVPSQQDSMQMAPAAFQASTALANVEQSRAVAEVQASLVLARANPRNEVFAEQKILNACKRKSLANCAVYNFKRGGQMVSGPSIRLAEVVARYWGNITYGFREVGRGDDYSEVEAFAHDLETNVRVTRQFQVKHWRDTRSGGSALKTERDKYELVANMAQRRVRACLLELIPGDIAEMAEEACNATLSQSVGNVKEQTEKILSTFAAIGVTEEMIEAYMQRKVSSIVPADIINFRKIYTAIKDGIAAPEEYFKPTEKKAQANNLNNRFSGASQPESKQETTPPQPHEEKPPRIMPRPAMVKKFKAEIDEKQTDDAVNEWASKHWGRVEKDCPHKDDQEEIRKYATERIEALRPAKEPAAEQEEEQLADEHERSDIYLEMVKELESAGTSSIAIDQWCMNNQTRAMNSLSPDEVDALFTHGENLRQQFKA